MTKCLWIDSVYDNLDDISKMMLPHLPSQLVQRFVDTFPTIEITNEEIKDCLFLSGSPNRWVSLHDLFTKKVMSHIGVDTNDPHKNPMSEIDLIFEDPPETILVDLISQTISVDKIVVRIQLCPVDKNIASKKSRLFDTKSHNRFYDLRRSNQGSPRSWLKHVLSIFTSEKTRLIDPNKIAELIKTESRRWFKGVDIRSTDFIGRFEDEVIRAINGDQRSVSWLKVLKARSLDNEPIYSMELR